MVAAAVAAAAQQPPASQPPTRRRATALVNKADFERLLTVRARWRSAHFALHHLAAPPQTLRSRSDAASEAKLSTTAVREVPSLVDNFPDAVWFGTVVPKRHARRAVTRNLFKRQMRSLFEHHAASLRAGLWLLRLQAPFSSAQFVAARSPALAAVARAEIDSLLRRACA